MVDECGEPEQNYSMGAEDHVDKVAHDIFLQDHGENVWKYEDLNPEVEELKVKLE